MTPQTLHGMTPCPARPYTEPPFACYAPNGGHECAECHCGFAPAELHSVGAGVVGLYSDSEAVR